MAYTLQEQRDHVRTVMDVDETDLPDAVLDVFLRDGSNRIEQAVARWPFYEAEFTFNTAASTSDYTFASIDSTMREPSRLRSVNHEVVYIGPDEGDEAWVRNVTTSGEPLYWRVWGSTIRLYPTPNDTYTILIRGYRKATDWVAEGAGGEPDLPDELHHLVAIWALGRAYAQQEDTELATYYSTLFQSELDVMKSRFNGAPRSQPLVLNGGSVSRYRQVPPLGRGSWPWE